MSDHKNLRKKRVEYFEKRVTTQSSTLSDTRSRYFHVLSQNNMTQPIYPEYTEGPYFTNFNDSLPGNKKQLINKCSEN